MMEEEHAFLIVYRESLQRLSKFLLQQP